MANYQVTPQDVADAAASCDSTAGEVQDLLSQLRSYVVNMEGWWQGVASDSFQSLMQEYDVYSNMLHQALTDIGSGLRGNYVNYTDSEQANVTTITSIQNGLKSANLS